MFRERHGAVGGGHAVGDAPCEGLHLARLADERLRVVLDVRAADVWQRVDEGAAGALVQALEKVATTLGQLLQLLQGRLLQREQTQTEQTQTATDSPNSVTI